MKLFKIPLQVQKWLASALHLIFLAVMCFGIGVMYLNDNFGAGIAHIQNVTYEDTDEFNEQFNEDINNLFHFMEYEKVFSKNGSIDVSKKMLQMTFGPNETMDFSLADLISYLQSLGYTLNEDFLCTKPEQTAPGSNPSPQSSTPPREGYIDWSASEPDRVYNQITPGMRRTTLESVALEIMDVLHRYYTTYTRLMTSDSNLHFKIEFKDPSSGGKRFALYCNDDSLTPETVRNFGRYAYLPGNSVFYDTNVKSIPLNTISELATSNPYEGNDYYLLMAVDTSYPVDDIYSQSRSSYISMQHNYISGFVLLTAGAIIALISLLFLFRVSGYKNHGDHTITLHRFDKICTETCILMFGFLTVAAGWLCRLTLVRIAHLTFSEGAWALSEQILYSATLYLCGLLLFFSLLRRYKAGTLWTGSHLFRWKKRLEILFTGESFTGRLSASFLAYLITNSFLISLGWFIWDRVYLNQSLTYILMTVVLLSWGIFNLWVFYILFRRASEQDQIRTAAERLAAGETSYQIDLDGFDGQELTLADNINNISSGLETALQEKVKSERLKADLITNVSHDIKTPLTSIINYVNLIKRENIQDEKILGYLEVLEQKSQRLKTLTEDLVEASKASSGNLTLDMSLIDLTEMIYQTNGEFEEKFALRHLEIITHAPEDELLIEADGRRLWRVLENLYSNAFKYAMEHSRVYVDIQRQDAQFVEDHLIGDQVVFTIKNISANPLNINPDELTERFVRGDVARTTEGSGLGLSIAKDLTVLQGGQFELFIDGDLFKAQLTFPLKERETVLPAMKNTAAEDTPAAPEAALAAGKAEAACTEKSEADSTEKAEADIKDGTEKAEANAEEIAADQSI